MPSYFNKVFHFVVVLNLLQIYEKIYLKTNKFKINVVQVGFEPTSLSAMGYELVNLPLVIPSYVNRASQGRTENY